MNRHFSKLVLITWVILTFSCKPNLVLTDVKTKNLTVAESTSPLDSQIVLQYLPYKNILEKDMQRVISFSEKEMVKGKPESGLTNLLADLVLEEGQKEAVRMNLQIEPVVSFFNYGGIRTWLPKGEITVGKIFGLMPFENEMVYIQLTGEQLQQFYDIVAAKGGDSVGGVRFVISNGKAKNIQIDGKLLDPVEKYWMVTNDYSANGGDGLVVFTQRLQFISTGKKIRDVIISNFEERKINGENLTENLDGRIINE
jgi:2',3'-cyclic-nucleotide 2'-phosphodiesterase (5'-nucleotidase family)